MTSMRRRGNWSLTLPGEDGQSRTRIWSSDANGTQPNAQELSQAVPPDLPEHLLADIAAQIVRNAPTTAISALLGSLICNYWRVAGKLDFNEVQVVAAQGGRSVCGRVFKKGDLVWTCRQCSKDPTCVQCDPCFKKSNHAGHEVYFHRAAGSSGCCDCGDIEAWAVEGNCTEHNCCNEDDTFDPSLPLPADLVRGLRAVLKGVLSIAVSYVTAYVRAMEPIERNEFITKIKPVHQTEAMVVCLHNDDIHTYDEVTLALQSIDIGTQQAQTLTQAVDKEGMAVVFKDVITSDRFESLQDKLTGRAKLISSIMPADLLALGPSVSSTMAWILSLGEMHDGLRRVISQELACDFTTQPGYALSALDKHPAYARFNCSNVFREENQFPYELSQLAPIETLHLQLTGRMSAPPSAEPSVEHEFKGRARFPFQYCPPCALSVLTLGMAFMGYGYNRAFHDIVIRFQHDNVFKLTFSQVFTILYPSLALLHSRHYGLAEKTIFFVAVQFYTAQSVAELMSSAGLTKRLLPESRPITIYSMLVSTLYAVLLDLGCAIASRARHNDNATFLTQHSVRHKRFASICRDFEYLTCDRQTCAALLDDHLDPGTVDNWIVVGQLLQGINGMKRRVDIHVEREDNVWLYAADMMLDIGSASTHFISRALFDGASPHSNLTVTDATTLNAMRASGLLKTVRKATAGIVHWVNDCVLLTTDTVHLQASTVNLAENTKMVSVVCADFSALLDVVSIHIPLHRFLANLILYAANGNQSFAGVIEHLSALSPRQLLALFDYPLRALGFASSVNSGMWRRNGQSVANLIFNYTRPPLCKSFRDLDVVLLQTAFLVMDSEVLFLFMIRRMEIMFLFGNSYNVAKHRVIDDFQPAMVKGFLKLISHVFAYLPVVLDGGDGIRKALSREVFHAVLSGKSTSSEVENCKHMVGTTQTVSDSMFDEVLHSLCDVSNAEGGSKLTLKDSSYVLCDPLFPNLATQQNEVIVDRMRSRLTSKLDSHGIYNDAAHKHNIFCPLFLADALPVPHQAFARVRQRLFKPFFLDVLHVILQFCLNLNDISLLTNIIHVVTLQMHYLATLQPADRNDLINQLVPLLQGLSSAWQREMVKSDALYHHALGWVLVQVMYFSNHRGLYFRHQQALSAQDVKELITDQINSRVYEVLVGVNVSEALFNGGVHAAPIAPSTGNQKTAAQQAMAAAQLRAQQQMSAFAAEMSDDSDEEEDGRPRKTRAEHVCIICKEKSASPMGLLCLAQPSNTSKHMLLHGNKHLPSDVHRIVSVAGCSVHVAMSSDSAVIVHLAYNEHVTVKQKRGQWAEIGAPVGGFAMIYTNNAEATGSAVEGNSVLSPFCEEITTILHPVKDLWFGKHGGSRLHISTCGHAMHYECYDTFFTASYAQSLNQRDARAMSYDATSGESLCPLCRTLLNTLVPINGDVSTMVPASNGNVFGASTAETHCMLVDSLFSSQSASLIVTGQASAVVNDGRFVDTCLTMRHSNISMGFVSEDKYLARLSEEELAVAKRPSVRCSKGLHAMAASVSTTLTGVSHQLLRQQVLKESEKLLCYELMQLVQRYAFIHQNDLYSYKPVMHFVTADVLRMFFPLLEKPKQSSPALGIDLDRAIASMPCHSVSTSLYPTDMTIYKLLHLHSSDAPWPTMWPFLQAPLLTMDLQLLAIVIAAVGPSAAVFNQLLPFLVAVKVAQMLLDPLSTGRQDLSTLFSGSGDREDEMQAKRPRSDSGVLLHSVLDHLRDVLSHHASVPLLTKPSQWLMLQHFADSLAPFLHYLLVVQASMQQSDIVQPSADMGMGFIQSSWTALHLPLSLVELLQHDQTEELFVSWAQHMRMHYLPEDKFPNGANPAGSMAMVPAMGITLPSEEDHTMAVSASSAGHTPPCVVMLPQPDQHEEAEEMEEDEDSSVASAFEINGIEEDELVLPENAGLDALQWAELGELGLDGAIAQMLMTRLTGNAPGPARTQGNKWKLHGVYPQNLHVDTLRSATDVPMLLPMQYQSFSPLQGSHSAAYPVYALYGDMASIAYPDLSQFSFTATGIQGASLIVLPHAYTDLYHMACATGEDGEVVEDPVICLVCGTVLSAGKRPKAGGEREANPGECTLHAKLCSAGNCVFFIVHSCHVLLMRGGRACYSPSIYVDDKGEPPAGRGSNRPTYLSAKRYAALNEMYFANNVAKEMTRKRSSADTIIRQFWY